MHRRVINFLTAELWQNSNNIYRLLQAAIKPTLHNSIKAHISQLYNLLLTYMPKQQHGGDLQKQLNKQSYIPSYTDCFYSFRRYKGGGGSRRSDSHFRLLSTSFIFPFSQIKSLMFIVDNTPCHRPWWYAKEAAMIKILLFIQYQS